MAGQVDPTSANPNVSAEQAAQEPVQPKRKFLGKYETEEEAERGYKELERFAYAESRRAAETAKQLEQLAAQSTFSAAPYGYAPQGSVPGYGSYQDPRREAELQAFAVDPLEYLRKRDAEVEKRTAAQVRQEFRAELQSRDILMQWKAENPDLVRHEPLIATFVAQQPAHLPVREKLDRAAEEARRYLTKELARNGQGSQIPNPSQIVESPANASVFQHAPVGAQEPVSQEESLAEYVKERNAWKNSRMNPR